MINTSVKCQASKLYLYRCYILIPLHIYKSVKMSETDGVNTMFKDLQQKLDRDQDIRGSILNTCKAAGQISREVTTELLVIHHGQAESIMPACARARELFYSAREAFASLTEALPPNDYYKYQEHWRGMLQRFCFLIALTEWLETGTLTSNVTVAQVLGISLVERETSFHLTIEDYLHGLLMLCSELARLAVNLAARSDYEKPLQISKFVLGLNASFRLLNINNDHLRKRVDALKYDVKKIEEVVYDLSIRGLLPNSESNSN